MIPVNDRHLANCQQWSIQFSLDSSYPDSLPAIVRKQQGCHSFLQQLCTWLYFPNSPETATAYQLLCIFEIMFCRSVAAQSRVGFCKVYIWTNMLMHGRCATVNAFRWRILLGAGLSVFNGASALMPLGCGHQSKTGLWCQLLWNIPVNQPTI